MFRRRATNGQSPEEQTLIACNDAQILDVGHDFSSSAPVHTCPVCGNRPQRPA
jgi:hypothetical protein